MSLTLHDMILTLRFGVADSLFSPYVRLLRAGVEISRQIAVPMIPKSKAVLPAVKNSREAVANATHDDLIVRAFRVEFLPLTSLGPPHHHHHAYVSIRPASFAGALSGSLPL